MADKSLGAKILDLIPESLHEDLLKEVKEKLIEKGEVKEVVKQKELTPKEQTEMIDQILDKIG
jgi:hypothetical protein